MEIEKLALACAAMLACSATWAADAAHPQPASAAHDDGHKGGLEMGLALGRDYGEHRNLVALSAAAPIGAGFKAIVEVARGRGANVTEEEGGETVVVHERGTTVVSLKAAKELFSLGHAEFGVSTGLARLSAATRSGNGIVAGLEAAYPLSPQLAAKLEATRFFGIGRFDDVRANVMQAGIVYSFR